MSVPENVTVPAVLSRAQLYAALAKAQEQAQAVAKDAWNDHHKYAYASAEGIMRAAKDAFAGTGLALVPGQVTIAPCDLGQVRYTGPAEATVAVAVPTLVAHRDFMLVHASGESMPLECTWPVIPEKGRPLDKALASALTTSLAYLLRDLLQLPRVAPGDDMDSDSRDASRDAREEREPAPRHRDREPETRRPEKPAPPLPSPDELATLRTVFGAALDKWGFASGAAVRELARPEVPPIGLIAKAAKDDLSRAMHKALGCAQGNWSDVGAIWNQAGVPSGEAPTIAQALRAVAQAAKQSAAIQHTAAQPQAPATAGAA